MEPKKCKQCGIDSGRKSFCSSRCDSKYRYGKTPPNIKRNCIVCGKYFERYAPPSVLALSPCDTCSKACSGVKRRKEGTYFECTCNWCGASVIRRKQAESADVKVHYCNNKCKSQFQRFSKPVTREWLVEQYLEKELDCTQIAKIVGRDPKSVWLWLKDFGIITRKRGFGSGSVKSRFREGVPTPFRGRKHTPETKKLLSDLAKARGQLPYDPKVGPPFKGKRGADVPSWKGGITPQRQAFYSSPEWKVAVKAVWKRDNATCQRCGKRNKKGVRYEFDKHQICGFQCVELRATVSNLVLLCEKCHYWVHSAENVKKEFIKELNNV